MKQIAVLMSSSQHFRNTGMFSVEWAAYNFFKENFPSCGLTFYVPNLSPESEYPSEYEMRVPYSTYRIIDDQAVYDIRSSDLIVFWSDFFHTRHYFDQYIQQYTSLDKDLFFRAFFLEGASKNIQQKSIAFGVSLMFFDENKVKDRYTRAFERLYQNMQLIMPRDRISFNNLFRYLDSDFTDCMYLGVDPAFLLPSEQKTTLMREKNVGLFIGRRTEIQSSHVREIKKFAKESGRAIYWIDWMRNTESFIMRAIKNPEQARNLLWHMWLGIKYRRLGHEQNPIFNLNRYDMIITDTYHLAVNAIRSNVPVFCIGTDDKVIYNRPALDLSDKKKKVLMEMLGFQEYYGEPTKNKLQNTLLQDQFSNSKNKSKVNKEKSILIDSCKNILRKS